MSSGDASKSWSRAKERGSARGSCGSVVGGGKRPAILGAMSHCLTYTVSVHRTLHLYFSFTYISLLEDNEHKILSGSKFSRQNLWTNGWKFHWSDVEGKVEVYRLFSELNIRNKPGVGGGVLLARLRQEDCKPRTCQDYIFEFKASLGNVVGPCLKIDEKPSSASWPPGM